MMKLLFRLFISSVAVLLGAYLLPGVSLTDLPTVAITALVLGILNSLVKPVLIFFTLPLNIITLGLFTIVLNGFIVIIAAKLVGGFVVTDFWQAMIFSLIVSITTTFLSFESKRK